MESQIQSRMFEDREFDIKLRAEFEEWLAQGPDMPLPEEDFEGEAEMEKTAIKMKKHNRRTGGKYKGRGKYQDYQDSVL